MKYVLMSGSNKKLKLYKEIIDLVNKNCSRKKVISFIACNFNDFKSNDVFIDKLNLLFNDQKIKFDKINVIDNRLSKQEMNEAINDSSIVFLLGGDTLAQIENINKYELKNSITKAKIIIGISAGAINMAKKVVLAADPEDNIPNLSIYNGIGVTNINIEPHCDFNNEIHWKELEKASKISPIIVMNDDAYIIKDNSLNFYGTYLILKNKKIYYNGKLVTLEYFINEALND